jgi:outer membrane receptor for ferrienterochelin and colicin
MKSKKLKLRVAEVTYSDRVDEYHVIAESNLRARDLIVHHLTGGDEWKNIRVEDADQVRDETERVLGKISSRKRRAS